jgi:hypothetical protein
MPRVFNPDDYLQTEAGRVFTEERNAAAWERMFAETVAHCRMHQVIASKPTWT